MSRISVEARERAESIVLSNPTAKIATLAQLSGLPHGTISNIRLGLVRRGLLGPLRQEQEAEQVRVARLRARKDRA